MQNADIEILINKIKDLDLAQSLTFITQNFVKGQIIFTTSLGQEDQVITDAIFKNELSIEVATLDTGRLFQETYNLIDATRAKYKKPIVTYFPDNQQVQNLVNDKGFNSFYESVQNRKECCFVRKIVPLKKALAGKSVWITGLRAEQSDNRNGMKILEWDEANQLLKFNPLIYWTYDQVLAYLQTNRVPDNPLHRKGFISIGCLPCTRAIGPDEHPRAGRWWWEESQKECGLHSTLANIEVLSEK